jgi:hypothetical protein
MIFANGVNYSEAGALELSRVFFLNKGPNTMFKEITEQIFADNKYISRVIKVRDINKDGFPDIMVVKTDSLKTLLKRTYPKLMQVSVILS